MHKCLVVQIIQVSLLPCLHSIFMSKVMGFVMGIVVGVGVGLMVGRDGECIQACLEVISLTSHLLFMSFKTYVAYYI